MKDSCNKTWVKGVMTVVKPFLGMKVFGANNIDHTMAPAVFICNHDVYVGTIAALIYLPVHFRPWIHDKMLDRDEAAQTMLQTFENKYNFLGKKNKERIIRQFAGYVMSAMKSFNPIPVSRTNLMGMLETTQKSLEVLEGGDNLLIFPENPSGHYDAESFRNLHPAFGILGFQYYMKTGKCLYFYPCFADKKRKRFSIGKPVVYTHSDDVQEELRRVVSQVQESLVELSQPVRTL